MLAFALTYGHLWPNREARARPLTCGNSSRPGLPRPTPVVCSPASERRRRGENMPLPTLTEEQRREALAKAAEARKARAEIKQRLKNGTLTLPQMLESQGDDTIGKMKVSAV